MTEKRAIRATLRAAIALSLMCLMAWGGMPAPALAEMTEEAMGTVDAAEPATEGAGKPSPPAASGQADAAATADGDGAPGTDAAPTAADEPEPAPAADAPADADGALGAQSEDVPGDYEAAAPADAGAPEFATQSVGPLSNPRVVENNDMESKQVVTWDCVWLGSYPQTEVKQGDAAYEGLQSADWADGDAIVDGVRYRRISKSDATHDGYWQDDSGTYRYFRYEPVKWRILEVDSGTALAVADVALDCRHYHRAYVDVTWEASTVRSWLNGTGTSPYYDSGAMSGRTAQAFAEVAFTEGQLDAVLQSEIANANNTQYSTPGGNGTTDRVFLLSEAEVHGDPAAAHGFASSPDTKDEARRCRPTDYARAMGAFMSTSDSYAGNCSWWLRSPGYYAYCAVRVVSGGGVYRYGGNVGANGAVRPALNLDLSSPHLTWAGTVSSDGTVDESRSVTSVEVAGDGLAYDGTGKTPAVTVWSNGLVVPDTDYDLTYENNTDAGTATVRAVGKGGYAGEATATFQIARRPVTVTADDKTKGSGEDDPELTAIVEGTVGDDTVSYTLSREKGEDLGEYAITPTGEAEQGNYSVTFVPGKLTVARADISKAEVAPIADQTFTGSEIRPAATITLGGRTLVAGTDYDVSYKDNTNAGTATATVTGKGNYAGTKMTMFKIGKAASSIALADQTLAYTGRAMAYSGKVTKSGSVGGVTFAYYSDAACTKAVVPANVKNVGTYYVRGALAADANHSAATSAAAKLIIVRAFPDVPANAWYAGVVSRAVGLGLMSGYADGRFGPADNVTRGQVAVILWNMAGSPQAGAGARDFPDVRAGDYFYRAVRWASSAGVVSGYGDGRFGPKDNVTREQLAVMLANYAKNVAHEQASGSAADYASMKDRDKVSSWAVPAVGWCFRSKILSGSNGNVNPQGNATRAEAAKMVVGLYDLLA